MSLGHRLILTVWPRTERRALAMLLQAVPEHVRSEVISARKLTTDQVLFRLYCTYQPGGATERTRLLSAISDCRCGETVKEILNWIRTWRRYVGRAIELGVTLPDALVLVVVMQQGTDSLSQKSPQVAYRLNMIRQQLSIDQQPTTSSVMTYSEHLQAEAEEMVLMGVGSVEPPKVGKGSGKPSVKSIDAGTGGKPGLEPPKLPSNGERNALAGTGASGSSGVAACKYWGTNDGCKRGEKCKFAHAHLPKENRCFGCSALGHTKKDCPYGKKKVARVRTADSSGKGNVDPVIHLYAGDESSCKDWETGWPPGVEVIAIDTARDVKMNLHNPAVWGFLCHLARTCPVAAVVGGPPCRTVSRLRQIPTWPTPIEGTFLGREVWVAGVRSISAT